MITYANHEDTEITEIAQTLGRPWFPQSLLCVLRVLRVSVVGGSRFVQCGLLLSLPVPSYC